jgi:3-hydroxyacyl-CoA dehydrogenase
MVRQDFSAEKIMTTILTKMQTEGKSLLSEKISQNPEAIDVVMVNGYGFPRWRGGPMFMAKSDGEI